MTKIFSLTVSKQFIKEQNKNLYNKRAVKTFVFYSPLNVFQVLCQLSAEHTVEDVYYEINEFSKHLNENVDKASV